MGRAWARGWTVRRRAVRQEREVEGGRAQAGRPPRHRVAHLGDGFTWESTDIDETVAKGRHAWEVARREDRERRLRPGDPRRGHLRREVRMGRRSTTSCEVLDDRPARTNVVVTGRYAPDELIEIADTVTEMTKVKHAMDAGHQGPQGHRVLTGRPATGSRPRARPAVVIAGTHSGVGKTTVATGLMAALRPRGHRRRAGQGRARLHRPRLPRARHRPAGSQPRRLDVRGRRDRPARRPRRARAPTCSSSRA